MAVSDQKTFSHLVCRAAGGWLAFAGFSALLGVAAHANGLNNFMREGDTYTSQLIGHYNYCKIYKDDCSIRTLNPTRITLNDELWDELAAVNEGVNKATRYVGDMRAHNVDELWSYPQGQGDSEDFVLEKRRILKSKGWPVSNLLITAAFDASCNLYAVLSITAETGDYILDSITNQILLWHETPYRYYKRQSADHSGRWRLVEHGLDGTAKVCVPIS